jgi:hypothetical protein
VDFRNPLYWNFVLSVFYLDLLLALYFIAAEFTRRLKSDRRVALLLLLVPLLMALPIPAQHFSNSFMHENIAKALSENPYASSHCLWYSGGECKFLSNAPWSYMYHLVLARFIDFGAVGIQLLNSISLFLFFSFIYFLIKDSKHHPAYLLLFVVPPLLGFLSTPVLGFLSLGFGTAFMYFLIKFIEGETSFPGLVATGMVYLHIRPENLIYYALLLPYFFKGFKKDIRLLGLFVTNLLVKGLEHFRSAPFSPEWGLQLSHRVVVLKKYLFGNLKFLFNPFTFNLPFAIMLSIGSIELAKKKKYMLAALPVLSYLVYTTKFPYVNFNDGGIAHRFLLSFVVVCIPAIFESLKKIEIPKIVLIVSLVSLLFMSIPETEDQLVYNLATSKASEIAGISNNLSMPVYSHFPYVFSGLSDAVFWMDDFPYPSGSYLALGVRRTPYIYPQGAVCSSSELNRLGELRLYNLTCEKT